MRGQQTAKPPTRFGCRHPSLPAGAGMVIVATTSLLLWAMIAGVAGIAGLI